MTEYWEEVHNYDEATLVTASGTPQTGIDFTMDEGGSITGRVTDASSGTGWPTCGWGPTCTTMEGAGAERRPTPMAIIPSMRWSTGTIASQ